MGGIGSSEAVKEVSGVAAVEGEEAAGGEAGEARGGWGGGWGVEVRRGRLVGRGRGGGGRGREQAVGDGASEETAGAD